MVELSSSWPSAVLGNMYNEMDKINGDRWSSTEPRENYAYPHGQSMAGLESRVEKQPSRVEGYGGGTFLFRRGQSVAQDPWLRRSTSDKQIVRNIIQGADQGSMERPSTAESSRDKAGSTTDTQRAHSERLGMVGAVDKTDITVENEDSDAMESLASQNRASVLSHWHFAGLPTASTAKRSMTIGEVELLQSIGQGVICTDLQGNITNWNRAAENMYQWKNEEVRGRNVVKLLTPKNMNKESPEIIGRSSNGESWSGPYPSVRKDGEIINTVVTDTPIVDKNNKIIGIVGVSYDVGPLSNKKIPIRRSYSDEGVFNLLEAEVTPASSSAESHNMLGWRRVHLDDNKANDSPPAADNDSSSVGKNLLRIGRSSVQQLVRKLQIRTPKKQEEATGQQRGDRQRLREEHDGDENQRSSNRIPSPGRTIEYSQVSNVYVPNEGSESDYGDLDGSSIPLVVPAKQPTRGADGPSDGAGISQKEVIKEVIVNSTNAGAFNNALSRSSSGSAQGHDASTVGSPVERNFYDNAWGGSNTGAGINFQQAEEDFQLQLALALRVAAEAAAVDDPDLSANVRGPKGSTKLMPGVSKTEATAYRYWVSNCLSYDDRIEDGFYEVWGMSPYVWSMCTDSNELGRMPPLENLRSVHPSDATFEVVLVDRNMDPSLRELEDKAVGLAYDSTEVLDMASKLSIMVANVMGGPSESDGNLMELWQTTSSKLMQLLGTIVLPIGLLRVGLSRHRALLFKVMADSVGLPCRLVRGSAYCGKVDDASVVVKCGDDREWMVDLLIKPGSIMMPDARLAAPPAVIASPLQFERPSPFAGSSVTVLDWARYEPGRRDVPLRTTKPNRIRGGAEEGRKSMSAEAAGGAENQHLVVTQGLEFSDSSARGSRGNAGGSNESAPKDRPGLVSLLGNGAGFASEQPVRPRAGAKASFLTEDITRPPAVIDNSPKKNSHELKNPGTKVPSQEMFAMYEIKPYEQRAWAKEERRVTGSDEYSRSEGAGRMLDQIASEASDFEIAWDDVVIGERIGQGSYGKVYRADWQGSDVAVKVFLDQDLKTEALEEFKSEVAIMRRLRHPNIVLFMGAVTKPPNLSIITEFCPRGSLYRLLHRPNRELDERKRIRMAVDVVKGMNYLHRCSPPVVHRDLKSPNLLVDKNWTVKVADFGLSRQKHSTFLSSKSSAGTPEWMAPEVLRNEPSDEKSDVYSFGVILWELATLQVPWNGMNPIQVVGAVGFQHRRLPTDTIDPSLAAIIQACWRTDSKLRPSFADLMQELKNLQTRPTAASPAQSPSATPQSGSSK
ncbi:sterile alpha motif and leucine zipper containing kinase AZK [Marchantia polymorpha subsp. ruderalis]|uniref:non-specific serine/threonine protein kinase n=1 Tax=Marchantia polymorpha TaxID=3197 RepID=A0A2R6W4L7_MARPO|nr:hypothetical protein MARPO_0154s0032 [Marchantia polymorpha]PTQ28807.1 hypothetical protein MARPO_0154s0032 [Marchantia polymorpha]BBN20086.1 hypothetical protein Mp_8g16320 [Marchantia polymorpha subsp. ruderalis]BBN20087.1 hypothetical protein Mp_8g16320 [Marchantia polymorpha subsp. ruderalis]|eukprot:PTQ28806.1 hypothetical protein MARPO_0154s0032 [Marchantia polymorpha]